MSEFILAITSFFPYDPDHEIIWCSIQALMMTWFQIASQLWTCIIGYTAFISVIKTNHIESNRARYRLIFLAIGFLSSGGLASMYI